MFLCELILLQAILSQYVPATRRRVDLLVKGHLIVIYFGHYSLA